jgi:AAA domain-containing protein
VKITKANSNHAPILLIYGAEGRGKTTLAAKFDKTIWFPFERGLPRGIEVDAVTGIDSFEGAMNALRDVFKDEHDYSTLVMDTVDAFEPLVWEHVCADQRVKNIETLAYGKGYVLADAVWRRALNALTAIRDKRGMTVVLICHATIDRIEDPRAPTYTAYTPKLHKRARALVMDSADVVGFLAEDLRTVTDGDGFRERVRAAAVAQRFLFVEGTPAFSAKNRFGMPAKIAVSVDFDITQLTNYWQKG